MRHVLRIFLCLGALAFSGSARADCPKSRVVEFRFTPTQRAQMALWVESEDGRLFANAGLTQATAYRGIGNRPGAMQMNSGFRWPYGRRESVLPVWAHRHAQATGRRFPRVIFQNRRSEGHASRSVADASRDDYYCLSFLKTNSSREALDAVSCASIFNSDKGRYMSEADTTRIYGEPYEDPIGSGRIRPLSIDSLYPARRDVGRCTAIGCVDHVDLERFADDVRQIMPEIDAITLATPPGEVEQLVTVELPIDWPDGNYVAYVEVNVEGDYNGEFNPQSYPSPNLPEGMWDTWAKTYGYPYRAQPSVVYRLPFALSAQSSQAALSEAWGYGAPDGQSGDVTPLDGRITNDPAAAPGSGADRLRLREGARLNLRVQAIDYCGGASPPPECATSCQGAPGSVDPLCPGDMRCGPEGKCVGLCDLCLPPEPILDLAVSPHSERRQAHHWGRLSFRVPASPRPIVRYDVRFSTQPITDSASFARALPANAASLDSVKLEVPSERGPMDLVEVDFGGMVAETTYFVGVRAVDVCNASSPVVSAELRTLEIEYARVSPWPTCALSLQGSGGGRASWLFGLGAFSLVLALLLRARRR